jgi:hypothetical protein
MKIELLKLLSEVINEVGDLKNITPFPFTLSNDTAKFNFEFQGETFKGAVNLTLWGDKEKEWLKFPPIVGDSNRPIYSIGYSIEGDDTQVFKGDTKILLQIIKTVSEVSSKFLERLEGKNPIFIFFATSKKGEGYEDPQKLNLYRVVLSQNLPTGWRLGYGDYTPLNVKFIYISK